jgi:hypothetical protein
MKSKAFGLFITSGLILIGTFTASAFWQDLGYGKNFIPLGVSTTIAFAVSIAGLIIGLGERKNSPTVKTWIGLIGNFIVVGLFAVLIIYVINN